MMRIPGRALIGVTAMMAGAPVAAAGVTPGQWETSVTITSVSMPGAPAGVAKSMQGKTSRMSHCITAEQAAKGPQDMLKSAKNCRFSRYSMVGGRYDADMVCEMGGGGRMTVVSSGSFTPNSYSATAKSVMSGQMPMTMTSTSTGKRVGACAK